MHKFYPLKVLDKQQLTPESVSVKLAIPPALKELFRFEPGQFVMVEKEINGENLRRYYSVYSAKDEPTLNLGIKMKETDGFARYAMHDLQEGDILRVSVPMHDLPFELQRGARRKFLAVTIGSGITPFYSMIQSLLKAEPQSRMVLVYGNHNPQKTMFYDELKNLEKQYPRNLKIYWVFSQSDEGDFQGRISPAVLQKVLEEEGLDFDAVYIIGPDDLKKQTARSLENAGMEPQKMHYRVYS